MKLVLFALAIVALFSTVINAQQDPCYKVVQSGPSCSVDTRCSNGNVFWSYPTKSCVFHIDSGLGKPSQLDIYVQEQYARDYTMKIIDVQNV